MANNKLFAENLLRLMKIQNLTPKELGEKVHASESTVAAWCRGEKEPYPVLREPLCMALCCGEDVLFGKENLAFEAAPETAKPAKEEKPAEPEIGTANAEPAAEPAEVPVAKVKKAPVDKKKVTKPVTPTVSDKEKILAAMRETGRAVKTITKSMSVDDATTWLEAVIASSITDVTDSIKSLGEIAKAGIPSSFEDKPVIEDKYKALLDAAVGASDEGLAMAEAILKKFRA